MSTFKKIAQEFGQSVEVLQKNQELHSYQEINGIDDLKQWLMKNGMQSTPSNEVLMDTMRNEKNDESKLPENDLVQKGMNYLFSNGTLLEEEKKTLNNVIPKRIEQISIVDKTIEEGQIWELGTSSTPVDINIGTLTMKSGSAIRAYNTAVNLRIEKLIKENGSTKGKVNYDFGFFGINGTKGTVGAIGGTGGAGAPGSKGEASSPGIAGKGGGPGSKGDNGGKGHKGGMGQDGLPCMPATITIKDLTRVSSLVVSTCSGAGGDGGDGGKGGTGGAGGKGGDGITTGCEGNNGGPGGMGGIGGQGGDGGDGGNAVNGYDININIPVTETSSKIIKVMDTAQPGAGGVGGAGGAGGAGGVGGDAGKHSDSGQSAGNGASGDPGEMGKSGAISGYPGNICVSLITF